MPSFLPSVAQQLFRDIQKTYQETSQIPDDLLIALKFVFGSCALQALDLVDHRSVTCLSSPSGRKAFQNMEFARYSCHWTLPMPYLCCGTSRQWAVPTPDPLARDSFLRSIPMGARILSRDKAHKFVELFTLAGPSEVIGGSGRLYTCFLSCHYCPCPAFAYTVLRRNEGLLCKHILAVYLCQAVAVTRQDSVSDQQMSMLLSGTAAL